MKNLPGKEFAEAEGYTLHSYSGNSNSATYTKSYPNGTIYLTCYVDNLARLEKVIGMVRCVVDTFSIPNKNFELFEAQLNNIVDETKYSPSK